MLCGEKVWGRLRHFEGLVPMAPMVRISLINLACTNILFSSLYNFLGDLEKHKEGCGRLWLFLGGGKRVIGSASVEIYCL